MNDPSPATVRYRGRFAPSPTGPLHFGSLVAALGSWLDARSRGGEWLVRMEDLDPPREVAGAADLILRALEVHGLSWDRSVLYQSARGEAYAYALEQLLADGTAYHCACSRKEATEAARARGLPAYVYPGTCRGRSRRAQAVRVDTRGEAVSFDDRLQGRQVQALESEVGDFIVRRADGLYAYQLAVVVDDAFQGITDVVRGSDLLDSTGRQIHLQRLLGRPTPAYLHLPVAVNEERQKLSKQTHAPPLDLKHPGPALWRALRFLGQDPPAELAAAPPDELLPWARGRWSAATLPACLSLPEPGMRFRPGDGGTEVV